MTCSGTLTRDSFGMYIASRVNFLSLIIFKLRLHCTKKRIDSQPVRALPEDEARALTWRHSLACCRCEAIEDEQGERGGDEADGSLSGLPTADQGQVLAQHAGKELARGLPQVQLLRGQARGGRREPVHAGEPDSLQAGLPPHLRQHRPLLRLQEGHPGVRIRDESQD